MEKIRCTRNEMHEILKKAISDCYAGKMKMQEYNALEFDIIPIDFSRFPKLKKDTAEYINKVFDEETTDRNGNFMLRGRVYDSLSLWFRDKEKLHLNYAPYGFYYSGFGFNDEERLIYIWCEGDTTVTLFDDEETYLKERAETEKWYEENT